jgi:hypothetical protein
MRRMIALVVTAVGLAALQAPADDAKSPKRLAVPDDDTAAAKAIEEWLDSRAIDSELKDLPKSTVVLTWEGVVFNVHPHVAKKELDRLVVEAVFAPKDEFKGGKELAELAAEQNRDQNFLKVYVDGEGKYVIQGNLTFYDELTAHEFDAFLNLYAGVLKRFVLTKDALKYLK